MEGTLEMLCMPGPSKSKGSKQKNPSWEAKYFVLDDDLLEYANSLEEYEHGEIIGSLHLDITKIKKIQTYDQQT